MFSADFPDNQEKTSLPALAAWVREIAELTTPDEVVWCDGSQEEWDRLTTLLVENGTFTRLNPKLRPNSFWCVSDPGDVARISAGAIQLLVGPASCSRSEQMNVRSSTRATSPGSECAQ